MQLASKSRTHALALTALFAALTAIGAFLRITTPFSSFTLQFFFTCIAAVLLGAKYGALSQAIYVALGLVGLPIFTAGGGLFYFLQPTFGFLLGLIPAAALIGLIAGDGTSSRRTMVGCVAGLGVLYAVGLPYMALILNGYLGKGMNLSAILWAGMLPFLPWDAAKIVATVLLTRKLIPTLKRAGGSAMHP